MPGATVSASVCSRRAATSRTLSRSSMSSTVKPAPTSTSRSHGSGQREEASPGEVVRRGARPTPCRPRRDGVRRPRPARGRGAGRPAPAAPPSAAGGRTSARPTPPAGSGPAAAERADRRPPAAAPPRGPASSGWRPAPRPAAAGRRCANPARSPGRPPGRARRGPTAPAGRSPPGDRRRRASGGPATRPPRALYTAMLGSALTAHVSSRVPPRPCRRSARWRRPPRMRSRTHGACAPSRRVPHSCRTSGRYSGTSGRHPGHGRADRPSEAHATGESVGARPLRGNRIGT